MAKPKRTAKRTKHFVSEQATRERVRPPRFRVLPITITMAVLLLGVKLNELYNGAMEVREVLNISSAYAEEEPNQDVAKDESADTASQEETDAMPEKDAKDGDPVVVKAADQADMMNKRPNNPKNNKEGDVELASLNPDAASPENEEQQRHFSQIELDILQSLAERRKELEKRAEQMDLKEKLLEATELRINDKLTEMKSLQGEVTKLLKEYNDMEDNKLSGLVKIYETMKPKDAAKIFNELDMEIMLEVADRMASRRVAPILAAMDPMRAKDLTTQLAEYRKLKALPKTLGSN